MITDTRSRNCPKVQAPGDVGRVAGVPERGAVSLEEIDLIDGRNFVAGVPHEWFAELRREAPVYWHPEAGRPPRRLLGRHPLRRLRPGQPGLGALLLGPARLALPRNGRRPAGPAAADDAQHGPDHAHALPPAGQQGLHPQDGARPRAADRRLRRRHHRCGVRARYRRLRRGDGGRAPAPRHRRAARRAPGGPPDGLRLVQPDDRRRRPRVPGRRGRARRGRHAGLQLRRGAGHRSAASQPKQDLVSVLIDAEVEGEKLERARARPLLPPAHRGRQRDDPEPHVGGHDRLLRPSRAVGAAPPGPLAAARRGGGDAALRDAGHALPPHGHRGHGGARAGDQGGRQDRLLAHLGQPRRGGVRRTRTPSTSPAPPTTTSPSAAAALTSAWGRTSPAWRSW